MIYCLEYSFYFIKALEYYLNNDFHFEFFSIICDKSIYKFSTSFV